MRYLILFYLCVISLSADTLFFLLTSQLLVHLFLLQNNNKKNASIHQTFWTCMVVRVICMHFLEMKHGVERMATTERQGIHLMRIVVCVKHPQCQRLHNLTLSTLSFSTSISGSNIKLMPWKHRMYLSYTFSTFWSNQLEHRVHVQLHIHGN